MKIRIFATFIAVMLITSYAYAQFTENKEEQSRWFAGGNLGLQFGDITLIDISPSVGYMLTNRMALGLGATYKFYSMKSLYNPKTRYKSNIWGGSCFARYYVFPQVFAHAEYEYLMYRSESLGNIDFQSIFLGGGYRQYFSERGAFEILLLYNLNETENSPYSNPVIRFGVIFGF